MKWLILRVALSAVALASSVATVSCSSTGNAWAPIETLVDHPSTLVFAPSSVGAAVGGLVGVPLAIIALPVTLPMSWGDEEGGVNGLPVVPVAASAQVGAVLIGGPFWLLSGGWRAEAAER